MLDQSDPRASLATYGVGATGRSLPATRIAPAEYVRFYGLEPQETSGAAQTWYARGQNFVVSFSDVDAGASFVRVNQPDEYVILLPEREPGIEVVTAEGTTRVDGYSLTVVPPGGSRVRVLGRGPLVRLFTSRPRELAARAQNASSYWEPHPNVAPLSPWPEPVEGFRLRPYSLDVRPSPGRLGKIFRCTTLMVNVLDSRIGPRDTSRLSPHHHDNFEHCSLVLAGEYVHHVRFPWTSNLQNWIEDDHTRIGAPSIAVIPPPSIHTSQAVGEGVNQLIDIFSPPRLDFSQEPGWVLNADDYPMA